MTTQLLHGDCLDILKTLPDKSVQVCVTSPPYFGLRSYTDDPREIGKEPTPAAYVAALVAVFAEAWRVLRDDGTLWVNLGDSMTSSTSGTQSVGSSSQRKGRGNDGHQAMLGRVEGLPPKSLLGMPWRVAFALQDAGWILRSDVIWAKPNCMPESVTDRPTRSHEYLFLFAKQARYFYDAAAIAEAATNGEKFHGAYDKPGMETRTKSRNGRGDLENTTTTRNKRTVWTIATKPYSEAHFATMPEALIEPCILAGSAAKACETCGAAWGRVVEREPILHRPNSDSIRGHSPSAHRAGGQPQQGARSVAITTLGFAPRCQCAVNTGAARSVVLDPFGGSGTVARVADRYQRDAILIDLNADYIELQEKRTDGVQVELFV